jgi:hypothetical protein
MPLTIFSHGGLTIFDLLGDSYDGTKVTLLPPTGVYTRIGDAGTTSRSLASNDDLFVSGKLEVDGTFYADGGGYWAGDFQLASTYAIVAGWGVDTNYTLFKARDSGIGNVEVARLQGAADPYVQIGRDDTGVALNAVTDMLVLQAGGGTGNEAAGFGFGLSVKLGNAASEVEERASLDFTLITATNGSEDANFLINLMDSGSMALCATFAGDDQSLTVVGPVKGSTLKCTSNVGAANTGVTAVEYGDGFTHTTVLTVSQADALTLADNAALADGYLLYTLPAGACIVESAYMSMAVTAAEDTTATADVGLGTVIGSTAIATLDLGAGGTMENILTGQTAANCSGTATVKTAIPTANVPLVIAAGDAHTIHFNVADTWADTAGSDLTADIAGTVVINWIFLA